MGDVAELAHRQPDAAHVRDVGQREHPCARGQGALEDGGQLARARRGGRRRHPRHRQPVARRPHVPGDVVGGVVLVPHHDLVARLERQPGVDDVVGLAGVAHEGDLVRVDPELRRRRLARGLEKGAELRAVRKRAVDVDVAGQPAHPLGHRPRRRAQVGGVHRHAFLAERELPAHFLPERLAGLRRRGAAAEHRPDDAADGQGVQEPAPRRIDVHDGLLPAGVPVVGRPPVARVPAAFEPRRITPDCVVRRLHRPDMRPPHALPGGRLAALGATLVSPRAASGSGSG